METCTCNNVPADQCTCDAGCVCSCKPIEETPKEEDATAELSDLGEETAE